MRPLARPLALSVAEAFGLLSRISSLTALVWLLRDDFLTDESAPLASPRTAEPGPGTLTFTDVEEKLSISADALQIGAGTGNPIAVGDSVARAAGLVARFVVDKTGGSGIMQVGWSESADPETRKYLLSDSSAAIYGAGSSFVVIGSVSNEYTADIVLWSVGGLLFVNNVLAWVFVAGADASLRPGMFSFSNNASKALDAVRVRQLPAPFDTDYGIASVNVDSPVGGTSYTTTADAITDLTLTAPNPLANEAGFYYRYTDDNNTWKLYLNSAGAQRLDSISSGSATNRISVSSVISAAGTVTLRGICEGSLHDTYSLASTTWTKRGGQVNLSHQNAVTAIRPFAGVGWTLGALRSYPRTSPAYSELDRT